MTITPKWVLGLGTRQLGLRTSWPVRDKSARMLRQLGPYEKTTRTINNYCCLTYFYTPHNKVVGGVYWFHHVRPSVCPSVRL